MTHGRGRPFIAVARFRGKADKHGLPAIHGEISVEHLLAHLLPLNSPGKFQVRELIAEQVGLHKALKDRQ